MATIRVLAYTTAALLLVAVMAGMSPIKVLTKAIGLQQWEETRAAIERVKHQNDQLRRG